MKKCGWLVPEAFEDRWTLMLGNSRYKLPELLKEKDSIDIFIHDSEHTYRTMMFEYCIAWDKLKDGGLLLSDDISYNAAFTDFIEATEYSKKAVSYLGIVGK